MDSRLRASVLFREKEFRLGLDDFDDSVRGLRGVEIVFCLLDDKLNDLVRDVRPDGAVFHQFEVVRKVSTAAWFVRNLYPAPLTRDVEEGILRPANLLHDAVFKEIAPHRSTDVVPLYLLGIQILQEFRNQRLLAACLVDSHRVTADEIVSVSRVGREAHRMTEILESVHRLREIHKTGEQPAETILKKNVGES